MPLPAISVIVAAPDRGPQLARCLDSLARQTLRDTEIIVADDDPQSLSRALKQARGGIIAVTNTHCVFPAGWLEDLYRTHDSEFEVIGGTVEHGGPDTLAAWACYLADYGAFLPSAPRQVMPLLAGNHVSYKRAILEQSSDLLRDGYWKVFLLQDLNRRGVRFLFDPDLLISCIQDAGFYEFASGYFRNARGFAAARTRQFSPAARLARLVTTPALPVLLLYRRVRAAWSTNIKRNHLLAAIPLLAVLVLYWSAGEFLGYLAGRSAGTRAK